MFCCSQLTCTGDLEHGDLEHGDLEHGDLEHGDLEHGDLEHEHVCALKCMSNSVHYNSSKICESDFHVTHVYACMITTSKALAHYKLCLDTR